MINKKSRKKIVIILVCILIPLGVFGFGYFLNKYNEAQQVASTLRVEGSIGGTIANATVTPENIVPGDIINQTIKFNSTSTAESLIRVKIEPIWNDNLSSGNIELVYGDGVIVSEEINTGQKGYWYKCNDGYFYYMNSIKSENDIDLVKGIKFTGGTSDVEANKYQNKNLNIKVTMEIIQSKYAPFKSRWKVTDEKLNDELTKLCPEADKNVEE